MFRRVLPIDSKLLQGPHVDRWVDLPVDQGLGRSMRSTANSVLVTLQPLQSHVLRSLDVLPAHTLRMPAIRFDSAAASMRIFATTPFLGSALVWKESKLALTGSSSNSSASASTSTASNQHHLALRYRSLHPPIDPLRCEPACHRLLPERRSSLHPVWTCVQCKLDQRTLDRWLCADRPSGMKTTLSALAPSDACQGKPFSHWVAITSWAVEPTPEITPATSKRLSLTAMSSV